jgi:O-antigen/teichoic acid export membrane protein
VNWLLVGIGILYLIIILIFREPIFQFAYGGNYIKYIDMIPFVVLVPIIFSMSRGAQIGIRAKRQPKKLLIAYLIAAIATFIIGPLLIYRFGFNGAIAGMVFTAIIFSTSTNILYFYKLRGNKDEKEVSKKILY